MKIYVVLQEGGYGAETLSPAYTSEGAAKVFVSSRMGVPALWTEHDAHGHYWSESRGLYRVDELELIDERQASTRRG